MAESNIMIVNESKLYISPDEYLAGEEEGRIKHEYRWGFFYLNVGIRLLGNHIFDNDCVVFTADIKVRLEGANCYYYPDVAVTYNQQDLSSNE